jgi:IS4 transposase
MAQDLTIRLDEDGADAERIDQLTRMLRRELDELDVERVEPLGAGDSPQGARGLDMAVVGGLIVTIGQSAHALGPVVTAIRNWLSRTPGPVRTVRVELSGDVLELSHASAAEEQRLVDLFVSRHSRPDPPR